MTETAIRHYFQDFPTWCAIKNITEPKHDDVIDWAAELVADNFISEEEAAELVNAAKENKDLMKVPSLSGSATVAAGGKPDESASSLGAGPVPPFPSLKKSVEAFAEKANAAIKAFYDSNSVMVEDCEGDVLALNNAIAGMQSCVEKASISLYSIGKALSYQKNEDTMKAISLLGDAIKELAGDDEEGGGEEEAGAPPDSLSSEVSAIYNEEPTSPNALPNPADAGGEGGEEPPEA
jgi:hypothetical protein